MSLIGFYPGSFDPVTNGHMDVIERAAKFVDEIVVGVGVHHGKTPLLSGDERVQLIEQLMDQNSLKSGRVIQFDGLAVDAARTHGASLIIRGVLP